MLSSSPSLAEQKELLRASILERLNRMSPKEYEAESRSIVQRLLEELPADRTICGFMPMKTEANIRPFLEEVLKRTQRLFLPTFDGHAVTLRQITHLAELRVNRFSIPEPPMNAPELDPQEDAIALLPGRAFDLQGGRLGRGNGAYDRWVIERRKTQSASAYYGTALACQIVQAIPMADHDARLDGLVTARGLHLTGK